MHIRDTEGNTRRVADEITVRLSMIESGPLADGDSLNASDTVVYGTVQPLPSSTDTSADVSTSGEYRASYMVTRSGRYAMDVFLNNDTSDDLNILSGSPFYVDFSPNFTSPALTDVTGAGLEQAIVNATNTLIVTSKDACVHGMGLHGIGCGCLWRQTATSSYSSVCLDAPS